MKIAVIAYEFPPFTRGGEGVSAGLLVEKLRELGIWVDVYVLSHENMIVKTDMGDNIFIKCKYKVSPLLNIETFIKLILKVKNYDLIHGYGINGLLALFFIKIIYGVPLIATLNREEVACIYYKNLVDSQCKKCSILKVLHCSRCRSNEIVKYKCPFIILFLYHIIFREVSKKTDRYIVLSDSLKNIYSICGFDEEKMDVIPNFYDKCLYQASKKISINNSSNNVKILYVGRLTEQKGVITLIKAFIDLNVQNVELWIVGNGPQENELKLIANASNKKENIKFYGFKNYFELETFYRDADIFVHPCIWPEAFGRTILEAMLFKLAIITSNRGAPQEIIGDTGLIFEAENIEDLKNKLLYFICNRDKRIKFGIASHQRAVSVYSPDNIINDIIKVYSNVIEFNNSSDRL
jgi:starch synthase